jgi:glucoamylase
MRSGDAASGAAPGGPGADPYWAIGRKDGVGSAFGTASNVWYTLAGSQLTEVFYPTTDTPDVTSLSFVVTDGKTFADRQAVDSNCITAHPDPRSEQYVVTCASARHAYALIAVYLSDPRRPTVLVHLRLSQLSGRRRALRLYVRYDPALNANGTGDSGHVSGAVLLAHDATGHYGPVASALVGSPSLIAGTTAYEGDTGDPTLSFSTHPSPGPTYATAGPGNIVQGAFVTIRSDGTADLALGFGSSESGAQHTAVASLSQSLRLRLPHSPPAGIAMPRACGHPSRNSTGASATSITMPPWR